MEMLRDLVPSGRVVHLGCGDGLEQLRNWGYMTVGAVGPAADSNAAGADCRVSLEALPFSAACFDAVILGQPVDDASQADRLIAEISRLLRPEGILIGSAQGPGMQPFLWLSCLDRCFFEVRHQLDRVGGRLEFLGLRRPLRAIERRRIDQSWRRTHPDAGLLVLTSDPDLPVFAAVAQREHGRFSCHFCNASDEPLALRLQIEIHGAAAACAVQWDGRTIEAAHRGSAGQARIDLKSVQLDVGDHYLDVSIPTSGLATHVDRVNWRLSEPRHWYRRYPTHPP